MADVTTGRSRTGILHLYNGTPADWYCKNQNRVEGATYGSEYQAAKTAVEQVIDHRTTLRYLGVPLGVVNGSDASWMFGDNLSVVNSTVMPNGKLQKRSHLLNYHICREAQASGIINFAHIDGKDNPADILTCRYRYRQHSTDGFIYLLSSSLFSSCSSIAASSSSRTKSSFYPLPLLLTYVTIFLSNLTHQASTFSSPSSICVQTSWHNC